MAKFGTIESLERDYQASKKNIPFRPPSEMVTPPKPSPPAQDRNRDWGTVGAPKTRKLSPSEILRERAQGLAENKDFDSFEEPS